MRCGGFRKKSIFIWCNPRRLLLSQMLFFPLEYLWKTQNCLAGKKLISYSTHIISTGSWLSHTTGQRQTWRTLQDGKMFCVACERQSLKPFQHHSQYAALQTKYATPPHRFAARISTREHMTSVTTYVSCSG